MKCIIKILNQIGIYTTWFCHFVKPCNIISFGVEQIISKYERHVFFLSIYSSLPALRFSGGIHTSVVVSLHFSDCCQIYYQIR